MVLDQLVKSSKTLSQKQKLKKKQKGWGRGSSDRTLVSNGQGPGFHPLHPKISQKPPQWLKLPPHHGSAGDTLGHVLLALTLGSSTLIWGGTPTS
jgi:hypothetical protein